MGCIITNDKTDICQNTAVEFPSIVDNLVQCRDAETPALFCFVINCVLSENSAAWRNVIEYGPSCIPELYAGQRNAPSKNVVLWNACVTWVSHGCECFLLCHDVRCTLHWGCGFIRSRSFQCEGYDYFLIDAGWWLGHDFSPACCWELLARLRKQGRVGPVPQSRMTM